MSAFETYGGIWLNDVWHERRRLSTTYIASQSEIIQAALNFVALLFDESTEVEVQTSGSTGAPKSIRFQKSAVILSAEATNRYFGLGEHTRALLPLSLAFIAGKMMVARAIVAGFRLHVVAPTAQPIPDDLRFDFAPLSPYQFQHIWEHSPEKLRNISRILLGGAAPIITAEQIDYLAPTAIFASFGMAETLSHFAIAELSGQSPIPNYKGLKGVDLQVDSANRLEINWPGITQAWLRTNDVVALQGSRFEWKGRSDFLINSGGVKIHPEAVEAKLTPYISSPFFVHGIPHAHLGHEVVLFLEHDAIPSLPENMDLERYEKPKRIILIPKFDRTQTGKIMRLKTVENWENRQ